MPKGQVRLMETVFYDRHKMESAWPNVFSENPKRCWSMSKIDINNLKKLTKSKS